MIPWRSLHELREYYRYRTRIIHNFHQQATTHRNSNCSQSWSTSPPSVRSLCRRRRFTKYRSQTRQCKHRRCVVSYPHPRNRAWNWEIGYSDSQCRSFQVFWQSHRNSSAGVVWSFWSQLGCSASTLSSNMATPSKVVKSKVCWYLIWCR